MQTVFHHVLPLAMPGILTGRSWGWLLRWARRRPVADRDGGLCGDLSSAPVEGFLEPATALPVQVYSWASRSDPAFVERSAGAIIVLLFFLMVMNAVAIILRRRFARKAL